MAIPCSSTALLRAYTPGLGSVVGYPPGRKRSSASSRCVLRRSKRSRCASTIAQAAVIPVAANEAVTLDETLLPTGVVTGRVTNAGAPASATVQLQTPSGSFVAGGATQLDGTFRVVAFPGTYVLQFRFSNGVIQY